MDKGGKWCGKLTQKVIPGSINTEEAGIIMSDKPAPGSAVYFTLIAEIPLGPRSMSKLTS